MATGYEIEMYSNIRRQAEAQEEANRIAALNVLAQLNMLDPMSYPDAIKYLRRVGKVQLKSEQPKS